MKTFDAIIVGGGKAGKTLAMTMAKSGKKVAMVEKNKIGGTCINVGCIPTKTLVANAKRVYQAEHSQEFGIHYQEKVLNVKEIMERKNTIVNGMVKANHQSFIDSGMNLMMGDAHFIEDKVIEVVLDESNASEKLTAEHIFINTGGEPFIPPISGLSDCEYLTNESLLELASCPQNLMILGGGYIGLEFGQMMSRLGANVDIIEMSPDFIPLEDRDVAACIYDVLVQEGINIHLGHQALSVEENDGVFSVTTKSQSGQNSFKGDAVLVAVGRSPATKNLGLENTNIEMNERGFIKVNGFLETTVPGVYALGDVKGGPQFTHLSLDDFRIIQHNLSNPKDKRSTDGRIVPYTVFIDPELGRYGLTEAQAKAQNIEHKVVALPMTKVPRAKTLSETKGMLKLIVDLKTDKILGVCAFCEAGGEIMSAIQFAMHGGLTYTELKNTMIAHPTLIEALNLMP